MLPEKEGTTSPILPKNKILCTVTFLFTVKGIVNGASSKSETVFAWIEDGCTNTDCVSVFNPKGVKKGMCTIHEIIVLPVETVKHIEEAEEEKSLIIQPNMKIV